MFGKKLKTYDYDQETLNQFQYARIKTDKGDIWVKLYVDEVPNTVANFATLAKEGFYDGLKFHRVIKGFMAQGGCPNSREGASGMPGTGGPGWAIPCETEKNTHKHVKGTISMAHAGKDTGGSQFFICFAPCPHLDGVHTVFGGIEENDADSMLVLDSIDQNDTIESIEILPSR
ncbi:peptidylprolyl isomerase [Hydrogenimonas sp. SS33]|uniref:peptidylprolyl isomerase n=1 Tax=Hydrogenimonas leucolamina TaxID=2954236 RepID=UPI00336C2178